ncbi:ABC transporter substrate-binding protein [Duganella sp. Root1480D1]|uniref:ABC transporter substrate-binding protein n=1 Tax=Duganella sp. Root1480D1 TaxID=1736471 RepID=UPI000709F10A|nr:ABC transporter substrate-binding protein [Duganella sp. Root1480D1]KQZ32989.1 sugar ABC transporter substrate-binding protein [Duganella sp. Root1480D1]
MFKQLFACAMALGAASAQAVGPSAEVIHWWTSGGESAAVKQLANAYRAAGGTWIDTAIAGGEQARAVTLNRMVGGKAPAAAQFNISKQFLDIVDQDMLVQLDDVARQEHWESTLPEPIVNTIRIDGHYYAMPMNIHMQTWIWYSKAAFKKAGIAKEPATVDELFAALDKLKAAGLVPLAHGGQAWQEHILFASLLANMGGRQLYLQVMRDRDQRVINSEPVRKVLLAYKRLQSYVDPASPGRNWNDATAMLVSGKAGVQIMGDWAKGEFSNAKMAPGVDFGCIPGLGANSPYLIQGDAFVFPRSDRAEVQQAQKLMTKVLLAPATQVSFNKLKGSVPPRADADTSQLDACARVGAAIMRDRNRQAGAPEIYLTPDQNGAVQDALTAYWNTSMPVEKAQKALAAALRN